MQKFKSAAQRAVAIVRTIYQAARTVDIGVRLAGMLGWIDGF
jgi:hypothetical protein